MVFTGSSTPAIEVVNSAERMSSFHVSEGVLTVRRKVRIAKNVLQAYRQVQRYSDRFAMVCKRTGLNDHKSRRYRKGGLLCLTAESTYSGARTPMMTPARKAGVFLLHFFETFFCCFVRKREKHHKRLGKRLAFDNNGVEFPLKSYHGDFILIDRDV